MNMEIDQQMDTQPSYSYVNKQFHCHDCNENFKKMVSSKEQVNCSLCQSEFVEEMNRENSSEVQSFSPFTMRNAPQEQPEEQPQTTERREAPRVRQSFTYVTQTLGPNGTVITQRISSGSPGNLEQDPFSQIGSGFGDFFGNRDPFESFFRMPMMSMSSRRFANLDDIIEMSMRDANNRGVPPASEEAISKLEEVEITKENPHKCPICIEDIKGTGIKLPCGHVFDKQCGTEWLKQHDSCPVCRKSISPSE